MKPQKKNLKLLPSSPPYLYAGLGTQYYFTTVPRDIFGRAMPGTYFRAESAYFKRENDDSRDILTAFKYRRCFLDISNYEKPKKNLMSYALSTLYSSFWRKVSGKGVCNTMHRKSGDLADLGQPHGIGWENNEITKLTMEQARKQQSCDLYGSNQIRGSEEL